MSISRLSSVKPAIVTPAMLVSSTVPENDHPVWLNATTYAVGQLVIYEHGIYESVAASNTGNNPATATDKWRSRGPVNRWKLFDKSISSQTKQAGSMSYRIKVGKSVNYLGVLNVTGATSIRVRVTHPSYGDIYDKTISLRRLPLSPSWWSFYFSERRTTTQALFDNLNAIPGTEVWIDIEGGSDLAVGVLLVGVRRDFTLGVKQGARIGYDDYSKKGRNEYGDLDVIEGAFSDRAGFSMLLRAREVDAFKAYAVECRATACLWIGSERFESTRVYGFIKNFEVLLNYYDYADSELELEGLT